jgi:hypothetical protein
MSQPPITWLIIKRVIRPLYPEMRRQSLCPSLKHCFAGYYVFFVFTSFQAKTLELHPTDNVGEPEVEDEER